MSCISISGIARTGIVCFILLLSSACKHKPAKEITPVIAHNYPEHIGRIILNNCATAGCHNAASYQFSGGNLLMDTWEHLFDGGNHGAVIVPYSAENSSLLFFTNHYPDLGPVPGDSSMKMPLNGPPLSREDYLALRSWVAAGAPDKAGNIPFASNATSRQKIYLAHQGCDYVTVIDAAKHVVMRMIPVGKGFPIESAHALQIAADGSAYLSFWGNQFIQTIDTRTDTVSGEIDLGVSNNNMLHISPNGSTLLVTNWFLNTLMRINIGTSQISNYGSGDFVSPHGIASNRSFDTFFVTAYNGNTVYRIPAIGSHSQLSIDGKPAVTSGSGTPNPHNILMSPDYARYFVTCEESAELRVMDAHSNAVLKTISVGTRPQEMAISLNPATPYLFVTCLDDSNSLKVYKGSVYIINYKTLEVVRRIADRYYMPHAITVDDKAGVLYVFSRNIDPDGPVPHHNSSACNGRSGYYSIYDIKSLQPINNRRYEVTVDPYSADVRFKGL